jgi:N-acetyl-anhydromuramyl-L-alanine amidase AmpD
MILLKPVKSLFSKNCYMARGLEARKGIMLHFDDSSNDFSAVEWFKDPSCHVSYNRLYLDNGDVVQITPTMLHAAWHAGVCASPNANRIYYGLAAATNTQHVVTEAQFASIVHDCVALFQIHGWKASEVDTRIVGHEDEACFANGKLGRKIDPTGLNKARPILDTKLVREHVRRAL